MLLVKPESFSASMELKKWKTVKSNGPITPLIPGSVVNMCRQGVIIVMLRRKTSFGSGTAGRGDHMRRVAEQPIALGKIPSNGTTTLVPLRQTMAIDHEYSAHRLPMSLTI